MPLAAKHRRFVDEYLVDLNATQAAIRAGYSKHTARAQGARLLTKADIRAAVEEANAKRSEESGVTIAAVLTRLWRIATADARELVEYRRVNCRYCWSPGRVFQHTLAEAMRASDSDKRMHETLVREAKRDGKKPPTYEAKLYVTGFDPKRDPDSSCTDCAGLGVETIVVHDTRRLSEGARALYAGVRKTKDGIEVKTHDPMRALEMIGRHLGMWKDGASIPLPVDGGSVTVHFGQPPTEAAP